MTLLTPPSRPALLLALALTPAVLLGACGGDGDHSAHGGGTADHSEHAGDDMKAADHAGHSADHAGMAMLGGTTVDNVKLSMAAMGPESFTVPEGTKQVRHEPRKGDTVHLMVTLADAESGVRLPDATVNVQVKGPGGTAFDGPLYPMIGRSMGMHYGENMPISAPGDYTVKVVASPPKIGRHSEVATDWNSTVSATLALRWDGKQATAK